MRRTCFAGLFALLSSTYAGPAHASEFGLSFGLRLGYAIPVGDAFSDTSLSDLLSGHIPVILEGGFRFLDHFVIGLHFQYGYGLVADEACASGASCDGHVVRLGMDGEYRLNPFAPIDPWFGAGIGYEWAGGSGSGGGQSASLSFHGLEFLQLQGGLDFQFEGGFSVGPFAAFTLSQYSDGKVVASGGRSQTGEIIDQEIHGWLMLGVRAHYDLDLNLSFGRHPANGSRS